MKGMERNFTDREYERKARRELFLEQTDGCADSLGLSGGGDQSVLPPSWQGESSLSVGVDTAAALRPTLLQFEGISGELGKLRG